MAQNSQTSHSDKGNDRYQAFIQNSSEGIWCFELAKPIPTTLPVSDQLKHIFEHAYLAEANLATARMYGFRSPKSIVGKPLSMFMVESDPENIAYLTAFITSGYNLSGVESHEIDKHGNDKYFRNSLVATVENGYVQRAWGTQQDVTEQRRAMEALARSEERLNLALQGSLMGIWEWDIASNALYWSKEIKRLFGIPVKTEVTYEQYVARLHPDDREEMQKLVTHSMQTGERYQFEHRVIWPDGSEHWLLGQGKAYLNKQGKATRMLGTCLDIGERKRQEEGMQRQNTYLETLHRTAIKVAKNMQEHNRILKTILAQAGKVSNTSNGYIYLLSSKQDIMEVRVATGIFESQIGHTIEKNAGIAGKVWATGKPLAIDDYDTWPGRQAGFPEHLFKAGVGVPLRTSDGVIGVIALCHQEDGKTFSHDEVIALSRLADLASIILYNAQLFQELQESEERFRRMADTAPVMIWLSDVNGELIYLNQPWLDFAGRKKRQAYATAWADAVHPDDHARALNHYNECVKKRTPFTLEYRLRRHDGTYRWVLDKGIPRFSPKGDFQGFTGSCTDIDDLKHASELAVANTKLKTQKTQLLTLNKAKDDFIALASHQLRTPATAVKQYVSLLLDGYAGPLDKKQREYLETAFNSNERQLRIIQDLLKTAQIDSSRYILDKKPQDIMNVIQAAVDEIRVTAELKKQTIAIKGLPHAIVEIDAIEMKLVLANLLENASKYSYDGSEIIVSIEQSVGCLEVAVIDKGVGIDKQHKQRVFDKFTRIDNDLSDTVTGTGLGLYWVKRIVTLHGGTMRLNSKLHEGSTFTIKLPL